MPRERVVLTREDPGVVEQREYVRRQRRGFVYVGVSVVFDVAAALLIVIGQFPAGVAAGVIGLLITMLAAREFTRAAAAYR